MTGISHSSVGAKPCFSGYRKIASRLEKLACLLRGASLAACVASLLVVALPASAQTLPNLGDTAREALSPVMERRLGEEIMRDIRRNRDYLDDAVVSEYLNNFGAGLVATRPEVRGEADYDFFFFAVRDPMLNAFALPGGFIGVYSGLVLAAQTESELASVLAHEIGHVSQRHIARMLGNQKQDALIPLAAVILGALAASSSPDLAAASVMGGQGVALQRQLNFSRDAEREADRVGLQILQEGGFDTSGMTAFFGRVQTASRTYNDSLPAYLRSHPMTTERIADIQARTRDQRYKQRADSLDFHLVRARLRVLQDSSVRGLQDSAASFESSLRQNSRHQTIAAKYGLAYIAYRQGAYDKAASLLQEARASMAPNKSMPLSSLAIEIRLGANQADMAMKEAELARTQFPMSRGIAQQFADALIGAKRYADAERYLRDQAQLYRQEPQLQERLAKVYAALGRQSLQHLALAESYALQGSLPAALDQLSIARRAPDASFYDQSMIEARENEFKARLREEMRERQEGR